MKLVISIYLWVLFIGHLSALHAAEERVALVIGVNTYPAFPQDRQLTSSVNDAKDISSTLSSIGFKVTECIQDGSSALTRKAITDAKSSFLLAAAKSPLALVYFSGHGFQVGDENYLIPGDMPQISTFTTLRENAVPLRDSIMSGLEEAGVGTKIVILDCCRDNPFEKQITAALTNKSLLTKGGTGQISGYGPGFFLAFATSPGTGALDGNGARNSPFTSALLMHLKDKAGNNIRDLFDEVKSTIAETNGEEQVPWVNDSLNREHVKILASYGRSPAALNIATPAMAPIKTEKGASELAAGMTQNASKVEDVSTSNIERNRDKPEMTLQDIELGKTWQDIELGKNTGWKTELLNGSDYVSILNLGAFYGFSRIGVAGKVHTLHDGRRIGAGGKDNAKVVIDFTVGTKEIAINKINFSTSLPILERQKMAYLSKMDLVKLVEPLLRPHCIEGNADFNRVIIDPAGGGDGEPASYNEPTLKMALAIKERLIALGFEVVLTRNEGEDVSLAKRIQIVNSLTPAIYIRLTYQESGDGTKKGIESLVLTPLGAISDYDEEAEDVNSAGNKWDSWNVALATAVHGLVISRFTFADLGVRRSRHPILIGLNCPSVIFRGGYLSNQNESKLIHSSVYVEKVSSAIADAINNFKQAPHFNSELFKKVQRELSSKGLYDGKIDGVIGKGTRQALIKYQKAQGLEASGELSDEILSQLGIVIREIK